MFIEYEGKKPAVAKSAFIADSAVLIGDVEIGEDSSVWFNAVLRGDEAPIKIGNRTNIQDNCTLHCDRGYPLTIGDGVTIGHNAVVHGCTVEDDVIIGMGSTVINGACIRKKSFVGAHSFVKSGSDFPEGSLIVGSPAVLKAPLGESRKKVILDSALNYIRLSKSYKKNEK